MRYAGNVKFKIGKNPNGKGWLALFTCPDESCRADASATSTRETGPYNGSCSNGHPIHVPYVEKC
jgi:hypothetical protein